MFPFPSSRGSFPASFVPTALAFTFVFGFSSACAQDAAPSQSAHRARIEEVFQGLDRGRSISDVAVSPDGKRLAWVEGGRGGGLLYVAAISDPAKGERVMVTPGSPEQHCHESQAIWAPDSKALAFFSDCGTTNGQAELFLSKLDGFPAKRLTELKGYEHSPSFSPDGTRIAFLYVEGATRPAGALAAMKPPSGVIGEDGLEVQRVAIAQVNVAAPAAPTQVTPANLHVYEFDWEPDSKGLAYVAADPPGENNWWVAKLYTQTIGSAAKSILAPADVSGPLHKLQIAVPRWSPDGKQIAFIGGLMSDQGSTGGDVWIISAQGGASRNLTPGRRTSPSWMEWDGNESLFVSELAGGNSDLVRFRVQVDQLAEESRIFSIPGTVADGSLEGSLSSTADRSVWVFHASSFERPTEIYAAYVGKGSSTTGFAGVTQLSHLNDGVVAAWGKAVSLDWKNEGYDVQGWLLLPQDYDPAKKYPLIVEVHGGPASAIVPRWGSGGGISAVALSALGYFVLAPNPRGSYGQGESFTQANRKDFGYGDLRDILAGVDAVEAKFPIDSARVGLTGWSYGGFMTMFAVTQTDRFKAAVAGAGISDWESYYGENSIDQWMIPYFGASVYDDPAVYAKASAITFIKKVHTPTLVVVGDRDGECPAPQSYEFWHALRDQGVATKLVVYPNEGHGFVNPVHRRDVIERTADWFAHYLPPG
jgi:dipeptidyl aminopeptidase/acylaminoacyl peptidase